ncbi:respiratory nitrate reductase subunit gamma [candidate division KSB1 bacterium]
MTVFSYIVFVILPFVTIVAFLGGMLYRIRIWMKLPKPGMTLFPGGKEGTLGGVLKETLFFPGLFRADKVFWGGAWLFHVLLALIFLGHLRVFTGVIDTLLLRVFGMGAEGVNTMSATSGGAAGILIFILTLYLMFRRLTIQRVKEISSLGDYIALLLITAILLSGNYMRFSTPHFDLETTRVYFTGLFTFSSLTFPENNMFLLHFLLAQLLIIYIPFSKILHFGGIFFSQTLIRRA